MEYWTNIKGYESIYSVSDLGRIWSINVGVMSFSQKTNWYKRLKMCKEGSKKTVSVHILVAQHFIPNPLNLPEVNHLNGDKTDCRKINLEWTTKSGNAIHARQILGIKNNQQDNRKIRFLGKKEGITQEFTGVRRTGRLLSIPYQAIQECLKKKRLTYLGWQFYLCNDNPENQPA